jgi:hypothetical protein
MKLYNSLEGKKTYLVAFIMALLNLLVAYNVIDVSNINQINYILTALGIGALRASKT